MVSPQLRDEPCVTTNAAVWARGTYAEYGASSLTSPHAWDSPGREAPNVLLGLVISVATQRRLLCVLGAGTCREVVCRSLLP